MVTTAPDTGAPEVRARPQPSTRPLDVALLGLGRIGAAVARRLADDATRRQARARIATALVRDPDRIRHLPLPAEAVVTSDGDTVFARRPDMVIELLGGIEPAFTLVSRALALGIPVVTANKSLLAARGAELDARAARAGVPLLYEASVLAGVPFLGALARRPLAAAISGLEGILNGTSNFVLSRMAADRAGFGHALAEAQRLGLAEPQPDNDVRGVDAAEKLAVLIRHFGWGCVDPARIDTAGIDTLEPDHFCAAREFGGVIKPIAVAARRGPALTAFAGPAFLPHAHRLARTDGADNALVLETTYGALVYSGPGAGPDATAATVLDDALEAAERRPSPAPGTRQHIEPGAPDTGWLVRLAAGTALPSCEDIADLFGTHGIWMRRASRREHACFLLTYPVSRARLDGARRALRSAAGCESTAIRAREA